MPMVRHLFIYLLLYHIFVWPLWGEQILLIRAQLDHAAAQNLGDARKQSCPFDFKVSASSHHEAIGDKTYEVRHVLDEELATAWVEGVNGHGIGQTLAFKKMAGESSKFSGGFLIVNGLASNRDTWEKNARVKQLACFYNSEHILSVELHDTDHPQYFSLRDARKMEETVFKAGDVITLMIREIYEGTKYQDTCLSLLLPMTR
ncbi:MAG: hypothetical protein AAF984_08215 [Verrucomicrobiota bacterium]